MVFFKKVDLSNLNKTFDINIFYMENGCDI